MSSIDTLSVAPISRSSRIAWILVASLTASLRAMSIRISIASSSDQSASVWCFFALSQQGGLLSGHSCLSTLPYAARYCAGDVAGERGGDAQVYEAMARGDFWAAREVLDPKIEWSWSSSMSGLTGIGTYHGIEGVEAATRDVLGTWDRFWQEAEEFIEVGDDLVILVRMHGRLKGGNREIEVTGGHVWTFRDARAIRFKAYDTASEALEAAGLSE